MERQTQNCCRSPHHPGHILDLPFRALSGQQPDSYPVVFYEKSLKWYLKEKTHQLWLLEVFCICIGLPLTCLGKVTGGDVEACVQCCKSLKESSGGVAEQSIRAP